MILIFSRAEDYTTMEVARWIKYLDKDAGVIRINADLKNESDGIALTQDGMLFILEDEICRLDDVTSVWYRKGGGHFALSPAPKIAGNDPLTNELKRVTQMDLKRVKDYVHFVIQREKPVLGAYGRGNLNKLITLALARDVGLMTPDYLISNRKKHLTRYLEKTEGAITKGISDGLYLFDDQTTLHGYFNYTSTIQAEDLAHDGDRVPLSLVQDMIDKKYEVRTVYLDGTCYSTAILSQSDEMTKVDYRRYNAANPNRNVPFNLPADTEAKLIALCQKLDLNTGSVDFIVDQDNNFIFLEINPVGQFGPHSLSCNYGLEEKIAKVLLHEQR